MKPIKVMVVDDQLGMRATLGGILKRKGYEVTMAEDGYKAIEEVKKDFYRIIFMDIKMPGINGVETFIQIKSLSPQTTVIMMTAFAMEELIKKAIQEGAYSVLYKPLDMEKVFSIVETCLESKTLILMVDDQLEHRATLKGILERKGYSVVEAHNGYECLEQVKERKFNVIILDIKLPGMDGVETLKQVKAIRPDVSVLMVTGYSVQNLVEDAMQSGAYACLHKPFDVEKIMNTISGCLSEESRKK